MKETTMAYNNGRDNGQGQSAQLSRKEVMGPDVPGLALWNKVCETPPEWTKSFKRKGGFQGTAIHPMQNARKASEVFGGPCGSTWGFIELETKIENGAPLVLGDQGQHLVFERIWFSKVSLWYYWDVDGKKVKSEVIQWGATTMVQKGKNGWESDEEAAKKSFTDAASKCLSLLGFGADIHMGMYDDSKYVNDLKARAAEEAERQANQNGGGNGNGNNGGGGGGYDGDQGDQGQGQDSGRQQRGRSGSSNQGGQSTAGGASGGAAGGGGQSTGGGASKGGQNMSPDLINLLQAIEKGIPTADAVPLLEKLFSTSKLEANIAAVVFLKRKIDQASEVKHLEVLSRRQKQLLDNGYINQGQHQEIIQLAEAKWDELDPPKNKIAS